MSRLSLTALSIIGMIGLTPYGQARGAPVTLACTHDVVPDLLTINLVLDVEKKLVLTRDTNLTSSIAPRHAHFENTPVRVSETLIFWDGDIWNNDTDSRVTFVLDRNTLRLVFHNDKGLRGIYSCVLMRRQL
jgi:hypothetical protein